jgi:hypothetical protein
VARRHFYPSGFASAGQRTCDQSFHQTERSKTKRPTQLLNSDSEPRNSTRTDPLAANWKQKTGQSLPRSAHHEAGYRILENFAPGRNVQTIFTTTDFAKELGEWEDWGEMQRLGNLHDGVGERVVEWAELFASALVEVCAVSVSA